MTTDSNLTGYVRDQVRPALTAVGGFVRMCVLVGKATLRPPFQWREFILQSWFLLRVAFLPTVAVSIPLTVLLIFTLNILLTEFGATTDQPTLRGMVQRASEHLTGWQYWAYCGCDDPTTTGPGATQAVVSRTLSVIVGEAEKLATWYRANGNSVKDSAAQAYNETMGHAYHFEGTYRVPNRYDAKEVQRGTEAAVDKLVREGGMRVYTYGAPQIMTEDALRNRSMWISNSNESGLELRLRGADGSVLAVHDKTGAPVIMSWADLQSSASEARVRDRTPEGNEEWLRRRQRQLNPRR